jgi:hypothetical protein
MSGLQHRKTIFYFLVALATVIFSLGSGIASAAQVVLAWDANSEQTVTGYRVYYRTGTAGPPYGGQGLNEGASPIDVPLSALTDSQLPQFSLSGLSAGTYYFVCTAYDDDGNESDYSNEVSLTVPADQVPPPTPVDVEVVTLDANRVMVTWSPAEDTGGSGLAGYRIYRNGQLVGTTNETIFMDSGLLAATSYAYTIEAFDQADNCSPQCAAITAQTPMESEFSVRINCGGNNYLDSAGHQWQADAGFSGGSNSSTNDAIARTNDDTLFQTTRVGSNASERLTYSFDVPNGDYHVNLYFVDDYDGTAAVGMRVFDIALEEEQVLNNLDIYAQVGHDAALIRSFDTAVTDGALAIDLVDQVRNPKIAAIEFFHKGVSTPLPTQYEVTASCSDNGSISPIGTTTVNTGGSLDYTIKPDDGYRVAGVYVDNESVGAVTSYRFDNLSGDHTIMAVFAPRVVDAPVFESGEVVATHEWTRVTFKNNYQEPIVVARSLSINGGDPSVVRVRNIDPLGFDVRVQEWDYRDGRHTNESIGYLVMERGTYTLTDGTFLEASTFDTSQADSFAPVLFERAFNHTPVVIAAVVSLNEADAVTGRMRRVDTQGFQFRLQEQEHNTQSHATESIAYVAWEPTTGEIDGHSFQVGRTSNAVTHDFHQIGFGTGFSEAPVFIADMQTTDGSDTANIRWSSKTTSGIEVQIDEEQSRDDEVSHTSEVVGFMAFFADTPGNVDQDSDGDGLSDRDETEIYGTDPNSADTDKDGLDDGAELAYWQTSWNQDLDNDGLNPLRDPDSDNDGVTDGAELDQGTDPADADSVLRLPTFESGEVAVDHNWVRVTFNKNYSDPVVVASSLSINGTDPSVVRLRNIDANGFDIRVQEWDYRDGRHLAEQVGYVVMERGAYTLADGTQIEAGVFENHQADGFEAVLFGRTFNTVPVVMASVASSNESDAVTGRLHSIDLQGFMYGMQEQEANEPVHAAESITYIAWEPGTGEIDGISFQIGRTDDTVTHEFQTIELPNLTGSEPVFLADMQTADGDDPANIRWRNKTLNAVEVQIDEEQSSTNETIHTTEVVGYMIFGD